MTDVTTPPTITGWSSYTEATHTVHGSAVTGAGPIRVTGWKIPLFQLPDSVTAHHAWRTQLGHRGWTIDNIHTHGRWVDEHGDLHPTYVDLMRDPGRDERRDRPRGLVIHTVADAPAWAVGFAHERSPATLRLVLPDEPTSVPDAPAIADAPAPLDGGGGVTVTGVSTHTEARHTVYGAVIHGAAPVVVPGHLGHHPDRWMRPERITITYTTQTGPMAPAGWRVLEVAITGPWVLESGEPDTRWSGCARAPITYRPDWVSTYIADRWPTATLTITPVSGD